MQKIIKIKGKSGKEYNLKSEDENIKGRNFFSWDDLKDLKNKIPTLEEWQDMINGQEGEDIDKQALLLSKKLGLQYLGEGYLNKALKTKSDEACYWTSTEESEGYAYRLRLSKIDGLFLKRGYKDSEFLVRLYV